MNPITFLKLWGKGIKKHASSTEGQTDAGLIINAFLILGCLLGAWQLSQNGQSTIAYIIFCVGLLTMLTEWQLIKTKKNINEANKLQKKLKVKTNGF